MAKYKRVKIKIGSVEFYPMEVQYVLSRQANNVGRRVGESMAARAYVWVDASTIDNLTQADQGELWKMSIESKDPLYKVEITYYLEDESKVLASIEFMSWVSVFQFSNPKGAVPPTGGGQMGDLSGMTTATVSVANLLYLELPVVLDETNVSKHKFTK